MRDGAHGEIEAGIHPRAAGGGRVSVVLNEGRYADEDEGDTVRYCGTSGAGGKPLLGTTYLRRACELGSPVRVLRSAGLGAGNRYRPARGVRFDGVYDVVGCEVLDGGTAMGRVLLVRSGGAGADSVGWG